MLPSRSLLLAFLVSLVPGTAAWAQCPGCVADVSCMVSPAYPALCPLAPPDATAGVYYETDITFWLPVSFSDPGSGLSVNFDQMTITGISGLPFGLSIETSEPTGIYYPSQSEYGCARICGTPLGAGTYDITISIVATVSVGGFPVNSPETFTITLVVLPGSGANSSFAFTPTTGCGSVDVAFNALIDASPQITTWNWDLGNGNSSTLATPPVQTYDTPGTYLVQLGTTVSGYVLNTVTLSGVNDNWCGDVEEPLCNCGTPFIGTCPDLYFVLTDASGNAYTSNTADGTTSNTWSNLGLPLNNPPYNIGFWDEDFISQNDHLGTYNISLTGPGSYPFNVAGGTNGSLSIGLNVLQQFTDTDSIVVFPIPVVVLNAQLDGVLCVDTPGVVGYLWFLDGDTITDATGPCHTPSGPGVYSVVGTDGYGCSASSNAVVVCPEISIVRNGNVLSVPSGFNDYAWSYNGTPIPDADQSFILTLGDGSYSVIVDAGNGCEITAEFELNTVGLVEQHVLSGALRVHPNPGKDLFTVEAEGVVGSTVDLVLYDMTGRTVHIERRPVVDGKVRAALLVDLVGGTYLLQVRDQVHIRTGRLIVQ